ncbi:resolvase-like protein [Bacillus oleivorans]|uniref:Resolvase-like protein n=1 Tax=Bacillus oleivorans TaxID=1448271 RepID=A0A285CUF1_9BACI|nr:recombinase family protein [Bacillus oleivorans]SNX71172.1 resolvase-like protein [Bacillus oleivorans]
MNEIKSVAIYCRVSTEEQASEGYSISAQLQTLRQYTSLYSWQIAEEYIDEGISGKDIKGRPDMQRLISDSPYYQNRNLRQFGQCFAWENNSFLIQSN